ncbi:MAG: hypothetical protein KAW91_00865 [candidate division Zixibacteria bacterium]|nr:hypothetical protein [candidate division Zixibacteria bacterium]
MYDDYGMQSGGGVSESDVTSGFTYLIVIAVWLYFSYMQYRMAHKTGQANIAWWAFVPILNTLLLIQMAEKPMWWLLLLLVPFVNIIAFFALWIQAARNCGQSAIWGFLVMIPLLNILALFVLAYSSRPIVYPETPPPSQRKPQTPQRIG